MNLATHEYFEKRNFIRMRIDTPLKLWVEEQNECIEGMCHNLSGGGLLISLREKLLAGQKVEVLLVSSHGHHPMLHATAKVVRCFEHNGQYLVGISISEIVNAPTAATL